MEKEQGINGYRFLNEVALSQMAINIGSSPENDIYLADTSIPDYACILVYKVGNWVITPIDPNLNILLNNKEVSKTGSTLSGYDTIQIGSYRLVITTNDVDTDFYIYTTDDTEQPEEPQPEAESGLNILLEILSAPTDIVPGATGIFELSVANAGALVANMQMQVQGIPTDWVVIDPPVLNLNEGQKGRFLVRVTPPHTSEAAAGQYQIHFAVTSPNYRRQTASRNAAVNILPFCEYSVSAYNPRVVTVHRGSPSEVMNFTILNQSNTDINLNLSTTDDMNGVDFSYELEDGSIRAPQTSVTVHRGKRQMIPVRVIPKKLPFVGFHSSSHYFTTTVSQQDQPAGGQIASGEVRVRPLISGIFMLFLLLLIAGIIILIFQPRIYTFNAEGKNSLILYSNSASELHWSVSEFASEVKLTSSSNNQEQTVNKKSSITIEPSSSEKYTLRAENFFSRILHIDYQKEVSVLVIPDIPEVKNFGLSKNNVDSNEEVELQWTVEKNADTVLLTTNKQEQDLPPEELSSSKKMVFKTDQLISLRASNQTGTEVKSILLNVIPERIRLDTYAIYVRPSGAAIPLPEAVNFLPTGGKAVRWADVKANADAKNGVRKRPLSQTTLVIPDQMSDTSSSAGPAVSGPSMQSLAAPETIILPPVIETNIRQNPSPVTPSHAPGSNSQAAEFTIKLIEAKSDPTQPTGYRIINYYPEYGLQAKEQIMIEWVIDGVKQVSITPLENPDQTSSGLDFFFPEKSMKFVLSAKTGDLEQEFALPVTVLEGADGKEEGECSIKADNTELTRSGNVTLNWTSKGTTRLQLVSSAKAEQENKDKVDEAKKAAEDQGKTYTEPKNNPITGGVIADYLPTTGFMSVNVTKDSTFIIQGFGSGPDPLCTGEVKIKVKGSNLLDLKFSILDVQDKDGKSIRDKSGKQITDLHVGDTAYVKLGLADWVKGTDPTGSFSVTDGLSTCNVTYPAVICQLPLKQPGDPELTATYSGDSNYGVKKDTTKITVKPYPELQLEITKVTDKNGKEQPYYSVGDVIQVTAPLSGWEGLTEPVGTITITDGKSQCSYSKITDPSQHCELTLTQDTDPLTLKATYSGDNHYASVTAEKEISIQKKATAKLSISKVQEADTGAEHNVFYIGETVKVTAPLTGWNIDTLPTGTITISAGSESCTAEVVLDDTLTLAGVCSLKLPKIGTETLKAEYSGDDVYPKSTATRDVTVSRITDLGIRITQVLNKEGLDQDKFTFGDEVQVSAPLEGLVDGFTPTGKTLITDGASTCTVVYPASSCKLTLQSIGDNVELKAMFIDDPVYSNASDTKTIKVSPKAALTMDIEKITEICDGWNCRVYPSEYRPTTRSSYRVFVSIEGWKTESPLTGKVLVSDDDGNTCTITGYDNDVANRLCVLSTKTPGLHTLTASYSGDSKYPAVKATKEVFITDDLVNFESSTSIKKVYDVNLNEPDHFITGQPVWFEVKVEKDDPVTESEPYGSVIISDGTSRCTANLSPMSTGAYSPLTGTCIMENGMTPGDPEKDYKKQVTAYFLGAGNHGSSMGSKDVIVKPKAVPTISFSHPEPDPRPAYKLGQSDAVSALVKGITISGHEYKPTGTITIKSTYSECTYEIDNREPPTIPQSCKITFDRIGTGQVLTAIYSGDSVYESAEQTLVYDVSDRYAFNFEISKVENISASDGENQSQPAYVTGQPLQITVKASSELIDLEAKPVTGTVSIELGDQSCTASRKENTLSPEWTCTINAPAQPDEYIASAKFSGDENYKDAAAGKKVYVIRPISTESVLTNIVHWKQDGKIASVPGNYILNMNYSTAYTLPVGVEGIVPDGTITVSSGSDSCEIYLDYAVSNGAPLFYCTNNDPAAPTTVSENSITHMVFKDTSSSKITMTYEPSGKAYGQGKTYALFAGSTSVKYDFPTFDDYGIELNFSSDPSGTNKATYFMANSNIFVNVKLSGLNPELPLRGVIHVSSGSSESEGKCDISTFFRSMDKTTATGQCAVSLSQKGDYDITAAYTGDPQYSDKSNTSGIHVLDQNKITVSIEPDSFVNKFNDLSFTVDLNYRKDVFVDAGRSLSGSLVFSAGPQTCKYNFAISVFTCEASPRQPTDFSVVRGRRSEPLDDKLELKHFRIDGAATEISVYYEPGSTDGFDGNSNTFTQRLEKIDPVISITDIVPSFVKNIETGSRKFVRDDQSLQVTAAIVNFPSYDISGYTPGAITISSGTYDSCTIDYSSSTNSCSLRIPEISSVQEFSFKISYNGDTYFRSLTSVDSSEKFTVVHPKTPALFVQTAEKSSSEWLTFDLFVIRVTHDLTASGVKLPPTGKMRFYMDAEKTVWWEYDFNTRGFTTSGSEVDPAHLFSSLQIDTTHPDYTEFTFHDLSLSWGSWISNGLSLAYYDDVNGFFRDAAAEGILTADQKFPLDLEFYRKNLPKNDRAGDNLSWAFEGGSLPVSVKLKRPYSGEISGIVVVSSEVSSLGIGPVSFPAAEAVDTEKDITLNLPGSLSAADHTLVTLEARFEGNDIFTAEVTKNFLLVPADGIPTTCTMTANISFKIIPLTYSLEHVSVKQEINKKYQPYFYEYTLFTNTTAHGDLKIKDNSLFEATSTLFQGTADGVVTAEGYYNRVRKEYLTWYASPITNSGMITGFGLDSYFNESDKSITGMPNITTPIIGTITARENIHLYKDCSAEFNKLSETNSVSMSVSLDLDTNGGE